MSLEASSNFMVRIDHCQPLLSLGLRCVIAGMSGFDVLAAESQASAAIHMCDYTTGLQTARLGRARVVVLAERAREFEIQRAIDGGILGYVVGGCSVAELESALRAAAQGRRYLCHTAAQEVAKGLNTEPLTERERGVLALLSQGMCNKSISAALKISLGTVKAHVRSVMGKLGAASRTEAASIAMARGMIREARPETSPVPARTHGAIAVRRIREALSPDAYRCIDRRADRHLLA